MNRISLPEKPGSNIPGLVVTCRCGKSVAPTEYKNGLCLDCNATQLCEPFRAELVRLFRKRMRYGRRGGVTRMTGSDDIAERNRRRIVRACQGLTSNAARLEQLVNEQGRMARDAVSNGKIVLPGR